MPDKIFRLRPQDAQCRESLCLEDYERAWEKHQRLQFERIGSELGQSFESFRRLVWGEASYGAGMKIRVRGRQDQVFTWEEVASQGRIEYSDIQGLMELGAVEFLEPSHRCISSRINPNWSTWTIRNRRDFQAMVKEMQELTPLHHEGMGNAFWSLCLPDIGESPQATEPSVEKGGQRGFQSAELEEKEPCGGGEIDYFDEDRGQAVCTEAEPSLLGQTLALGMQNMVSASVGAGMSLAFSSAAHGIGHFLEQGELP